MSEEAAKETEPKPATTGLSRNLRALKFMQRQLEADKRQELEKQRYRDEAQAKWGKVT